MHKHTNKLLIYRYERLCKNVKKKIKGKKLLVLYFLFFNVQKELKLRLGKRTFRRQYSMSCPWGTEWSNSCLTKAKISHPKRDFFFFNHGVLGSTKDILIQIFWHKTTLDHSDNMLNVIPIQFSKSHIDFSLFLSSGINHLIQSWNNFVFSVPGLQNNERIFSQMWTWPEFFQR